jgi:hypothetical protein
LHTGGDELPRFIAHTSELAPLFSDPEATPLRADDPRANDVLLLNKLGMNFSYAARLNAVALVVDYLKRRGLPHECELLSHSAHNGTTVEHIAGEKYFVYRHNAVATAPARVGFLSGFYDTCSYLYTPGPAAAHFFNTMDHGMKSFADAHPFSEPAPHRNAVPLLRVRKSIHSGPYRTWKSAELRYSGAEFVRPLEEAGIIRVEETLCPIYNLKT